MQPDFEGINFWDQENDIWRKKREDHIEKKHNSLDRKRYWGSTFSLLFQILNSWLISNDN